jgi:hypothetical protein
VIRLADADLLPFDFTNFAETIKRYVDELKKLLKELQDEITERNKQITEGVFTAIADPKEPYVPPSIENVPPHLNFAPLENAVETLIRSAEQHAQTAKRVLERKAPLPAVVLKAVNAKLTQAERTLVSPDGLPGRPWFRHLIYAPGAYTGYGVKTIPGVREAIEQKKWSEADSEIVRAARALEQEASLINSLKETRSRKWEKTFLSLAPQMSSTFPTQLFSPASSTRIHTSCCKEILPLRTTRSKSSKNQSPTVLCAHRFRARPLSSTVLQPFVISVLRAACTPMSI